MGRLTARKDLADAGRGLVEELVYGSEVEDLHPKHATFHVRVRHAVETFQRAPQPGRVGPRAG